MKDAHTLAEMNLPPLIQNRASSYLEMLAIASDDVSLRQASERSAGFVEGLEAARALTPATIEALFLLFENAADSKTCG